MKFNPKRTAKRALATITREACALLPVPATIKAMRKFHEIQISAAELEVLIGVLRRKSPCSFLVFGLGNDSLVWSRLNRAGNTVFLEDSEKWLKRVVRRDKGLNAHLVEYATKRTQWSELIDTPAKLQMTLPSEVRERRWDVILVDAPAGWEDTSPGRMKSIFAASQLVARSGDIFVHDCDRQVEQAYCDRYLGSDNLKTQIGVLRHYHIAG